MNKTDQASTFSSGVSGVTIVKATPPPPAPVSCNRKSHFSMIIAAQDHCRHKFVNNTRTMSREEGVAICY